MNQTVSCTINGQSRSVTTDPRRTLLDVLREDLNLTGTKYGCGEGQCRACTVLVDGRATQACQTTIDEVAGHRVETIEGLATGEQLHPVQAAFIEEGAMQCGYCVPGMILSTVALLRRTPRPSRDEIIAGLNGNLCRCCGYVNVLKAVERCAAAPAGAPGAPGAAADSKTKEAK
jgi:aerobic-type carbon monoxide dehydrogenase small subunit (CoxS/CutS family)